MVDGTDVLAVHREAQAAIEKARAGDGPTLLELVTLRGEGHAVHDDAFYVPRGLHDAWAPSDPLERYRAWLKANLDGFGDDEDARSARRSRRCWSTPSRRAEPARSRPRDPRRRRLREAVPEDLDTPHHR